MADRLPSLACCWLPLRRHDHHAASTGPRRHQHDGAGGARRERPARCAVKRTERASQPGTETDPGG